MSSELAMTVIRETVAKTLALSAPFLLISIALGLVISVFQAATQIHEQTITFVPKLVGILLLLLIIGSWMLTDLSDFFHEMLTMMLEL